MDKENEDCKDYKIASEKFLSGLKNGQEVLRNIISEAEQNIDSVEKLIKIYSKRKELELESLELTKAQYEINRTRIIRQEKELENL